MTDPATDIPPGFAPLPSDRGFSEHVGPIYITYDETGTALGFRVAGHHLNSAGICHGGMLMTVLDMAMALAVRDITESNKFLPTKNLNYDFLRPAKAGDWLYSQSHFAHAGRQDGVSHGVLMGPNGAVIRCNGRFFIPAADDERYATIATLAKNPHFQR